MICQFACLPPFVPLFFPCPFVWKIDISSFFLPSFLPPLLRKWKRKRERKRKGERREIEVSSSSFLLSPSVFGFFLSPSPKRTDGGIFPYFLFPFPLLLHNNWHFAAFEMWEIAVGKGRRFLNFLLYLSAAAAAAAAGRRCCKEKGGPKRNKKHFFFFLGKRSMSVARSVGRLAFKNLWVKKKIPPAMQVWEHRTALTCGKDEEERKKRGKIVKARRRKRT